MKLGVQMSFQFSKISALRAVLQGSMAIVALLLIFVSPALALPQGNAITDPKAILRNSLPIDNPEIRKLQTAIEDISQQIRANRRWGAIGADLTRAERVVKDKRDMSRADKMSSMKLKPETKSRTSKSLRA